MSWSYNNAILYCHRYYYSHRRLRPWHIIYYWPYRGHYIDTPSPQLNHNIVNKFLHNTTTSPTHHLDIATSSHYRFLTIVIILTIIHVICSPLLPTYYDADIHWMCCECMDGHVMWWNDAKNGWTRYLKWIQWFTKSTLMIVCNDCMQCMFQNGIFLAMLMLNIAFSLISNINQSACSTLNWVMNSQSELPEFCKSIIGNFQLMKQKFKCNMP